MKKIYIHCGLHKTGSTSLQKWLVDNSSDIAKSYKVINRELERVRVDSRTLTIRKNIQRFSSNKISWEQLESELDAIRNDLIHDHRDVILTDESLIGPMPGRQKGNVIYPKLVENILALVDWLKDFDVHLIFYVRSYSNWLKSVYKHSLKMGDKLEPFEIFQEKFSISDEQFLERTIKEKITKNSDFNNINVTILQFEDEFLTGEKSAQPYHFIEQVGGIDKMHKRLFMMKPLPHENASLVK